MTVELVTHTVWEKNVREKIVEFGFEHIAEDKWAISESVIPSVASTSHLIATNNMLYAILGDTTVVVVHLQDGFAKVEACANDASTAQATIDIIREFHPVAEPAENFIEVCYWALSSQGSPKSRQRQITADYWDDISANYPRDARERLDGLMSDDFDAGTGGQLLLWAGPAGTGKTTALRALAHEWRDWCKLHYVMDPEKLFSDATYLNAVILGDEWRPDPTQWRLLVLEDAGELLRKDAGEVTGKALMRLLNTVDGMIGQGLRIITLVTTNEKIEELHEAVARPGRCAQEILFGRLSGEEASTWRESHDLPAQSKGSTLADLYAELKGFEGARKKAPMGFAS